MFSSNKRPKFNLDLTIHEISNIPQVSGYCYVDLKIRDGKRKMPRLSMKSTPSVSSLKGDKENNSSSSLSETVHSTGNVSVVTSMKKIHNFKSNFNYNINCNLKFSLKKNDNFISSKYLTIKVYYMSDEEGRGDKSSSHRHEKTELGMLEINLSEYINLDEPLTSKFLMSESKVNSILNLSIYLGELADNFDFHTQLQVNDAGDKNNTSTVINNREKKKHYNTANNKNTKSVNSDRGTIFGGINDMMKFSTSDNSSNAQSGNSSASSFHSDDSDRPHNKPKRKGSSRHRKSKSTLTNDALGNNQPGNAIMMDPIVSNLYTKVLESAWDPALADLLEYTPEKCIIDIFESSGDGWNKDISQKLDSRYDENDEDNIRALNGLINEASFREDLRSWKVGDS